MNVLSKKQTERLFKEMFCLLDANKDSIPEALLKICLANQKKKRIKHIVENLTTHNHQLAVSIHPPTVKMIELIDVDMFGFSVPLLNLASIDGQSLVLVARPNTKYHYVDIPKGFKREQEKLYETCFGFMLDAGFHLDELDRADGKAVFTPKFETTCFTCPHILECKGL